jgi:hypothetical protein
MRLAEERMVGEDRPEKFEAIGKFSFFHLF